MQENHKWHYDYVRLAGDTGFSFQKHENLTLDKSKIGFVDVDRIIRDGDIATVEKFIPNVLNFALETPQRGVLEEGFVKTFRLGQLSVEYLLFCKRYLDNTVILLKKKLEDVESENKELKLFVEDLKTHVEVLMKELKAQNSFKCGECSKVFSTEEFLTSHKRRRHNSEVELQIKELKGRLNSAEKLIQGGPKIDSRGSELKIVELERSLEHLQVELRKLGRSEKGVETEGPLRRESTTQTDIEEVRVSSNLERIESQMSSFWEKLSEIEAGRGAPVPPHIEVKEYPQVGVKEPPLVVPRSKFKEIQVGPFEPPRVEVKEPPQIEAKEPPQVEVKEPPSELEEISAEPPRVEEIKLPGAEPEGSSSESESGSTSESSVEKIIPPKKFEPVVKKRRVAMATAPRKIAKNEETPALDEKLLSHFRGEIEKILMTRLQDLGVSPEWEGLPERSFERAMEIVNHQAALLKKSHPNFDKLRLQLEDDVHNQTNCPPQPKNQVIRERVEIRNRQMYETDTESDVPAPARKEGSAYFAVVQELIANQKKEKENVTKGVLKNYPSIGSLNKKKVLFDLSERSGGSSTSVASSVLDATPRVVKKDVEDLSDFDFSEM